MTATDNRRYFFTYSIILGFCMLFVAVFFWVGDRQNWMMLGLAWIIHEHVSALLSRAHATGVVRDVPTPDEGVSW